MKTLFILSLFFLLALCDPPKPQFASRYTLTNATWRYPLAVPPINDEFDYYHTPEQRRIEHYKGVWTDIYTDGARFSIQTARDKFQCTVMQGAPLMHAAIPEDWENYHYVRNMEIRGIKTHQFQKKIQRPNDLVDTYNFYYDPVNRLPVRWEMYGMSLFLGLHRDIYILDYGEYHPEQVPVGIFSVPSICQANDDAPQKLVRDPKMAAIALQNSFTHLGPYKKVHAEIPRKWDWRRHGVVGPIKNQAFCGSCYSFSAVSAIESHYAIKTGELHSLSESQVMDCSFGIEHTYNRGCFGGFDYYSYDYIALNGGLVSEESYPYKPASHRCRIDPRAKRVQIKGYHSIPDEDNEALLEALFLRGPLSVSISVTDNFVYHTTGILKDPLCTPRQQDHAVVLVGYDLDERYYIVRNSWSPISNDKGYLKISMDNFGCGISIGASFPVLA